MEFKKNYPLAPQTTFRIGGEALYYAEASNLDDLKAALQFATEKKLAVQIMGGGSNMLVSDYGFSGLVIDINFKDIEIVNQNDDFIEIKVQAGEVWDEVVVFAIKNNFWGIENLSGIPGKTGAVPVQNVGAYGQEANQVITQMEVLDIKSGEVKILDNLQVEFGYRSSNFNTIWKNQFVILSVNFKLSKKPTPILNYVDVKNYFAGKNPTISEIRDGIVEIRKNKFPDLKLMGTAGSFFKNLILTPEQYQELEDSIRKNFGDETAARLIEIKNKFPQKEEIKIPAAFLIDICGLKGKNVGDARLWEKQALVIVNAGNAKALDVLELFNLVKSEVFDKTGMELVPEPEFIGF